MNWRRAKLDVSDKTRKEWRAERGRYRIIWRNEVYGVKIDAGYHATVKELVPGVGSVWERVDRTRTSLYRTFAAAKKACLAHKKRNEQ